MEQGYSTCLGGLNGIPVFCNVLVGTPSDAMAHELACRAFNSLRSGVDISEELNQLKDIHKRERGANYLPGELIASVAGVDPSSEQAGTACAYLVGLSPQTAMEHCRDIVISAGRSALSQAKPALKATKHEQAFGQLFTADENRLLSVEDQACFSTFLAFSFLHFSVAHLFFFGFVS